MKLNRKYPCFAAHWKLLNSTLFEADTSVHSYEFGRSIRITLDSKYVCVTFDREYLTKNNYIDTIEIEYNFTFFLEGPGWEDAWCSFMNHDITFVLCNSKTVSEIIIDDKYDYDYNYLKRAGSDVAIVPQIGMMLERKINELCKFDI